MSLQKLALIAGIAACAAACSAGGGTGSHPGGSGGSAAGGSSSGGSGAGGSGTGGSSGGSGGSVLLGGSGGGGATSSGGAAGACAETTSTSKKLARPADIIWAVDQSGSMNQETSYVQQEINNFANLIATSGTIDYHVVMIAATTGGNSICVPPPLGGPNCGNNARFRLVDQHVDSNNALDLIISNYDKYKDFLRYDAVKHFVVVSDDNATDSPINSAAAFTNALQGLAPAGMFNTWIFHAIYAYGSTPIIGCIGAFGTGAAVGTVYAQLVQQTGGAQGQICVNNWQPVFQAITTTVVTQSAVSCEYNVPTPKSGTLDPNKVNVDYLQGGTNPQPIYRVQDASQCTSGSGQGGWYFDSNTNPTKIYLCPDTCKAVQSDTKAQISVKFGCKSLYKPPA